MLKAGILVKRIPTITRNLDKLSHAYYNLYNIQDADIARPFDESFYFKKGSLGQVKWDSLNSGKKGSQIQQPVEDVPEACHDRKGADHDKSQIYRKLDQNLYLVVKDQDQIKFPEIKVEEEEFLHDTTDRLVGLTLGDADVWRVGQAPIGNLSKTFFLKYHVLDYTNLKSKVDSMWLDKEECEEVMTADYYNGVKDML
jgi:large subunit ribosomal protein L46